MGRPLDTIESPHSLPSRQPRVRSPREYDRGTVQDDIQPPLEDRVGCDDGRVQA